MQSLDIYSAERYDFILKADQPVDNYWMRARGLGACDDKELEELAVIHYVTDDVLQDVQHLSANTTRPEMKGIVSVCVYVCVCVGGGGGGGVGGVETGWGRGCWEWWIGLVTHSEHRFPAPSSKLCQI